MFSCKNDDFRNLKIIRVSQYPQLNLTDLLGYLFLGYICISNYILME